jgi:hypothetical protein
VVFASLKKNIKVKDTNEDTLQKYLVTFRMNYCWAAAAGPLVAKSTIIDSNNGNATEK